MTASAPSVVARAVVAGYRKEAMIYRIEDEGVLQRLESDPDSKVSAAFNQLRRCAIVRSQRKRSPGKRTRRRPDDGDHSRRMDPILLTFYVVQAADLANSASVVVSQSQEKADAYRRAVDDARRLASFCKNNAPIDLCFHLGKLIEYPGFSVETLGRCPKPLTNQENKRSCHSCAASPRPDDSKRI